MNLGPTLRSWRHAWNKRLQEAPMVEELNPAGVMTPIGYVVLLHSQRLDRPVAAHQQWANRIPEVYSQYVLDKKSFADATSPEFDENCLAMIKHYRSLVPMSLEARKPIFDLKPADGAIGAHFNAVKLVYGDFVNLARRIALACNQKHLSKKMENMVNKAL